MKNLSKLFLGQWIALLGVVLLTTSCNEEEDGINDDVFNQVGVIDASVSATGLMVGDTAKFTDKSTAVVYRHWEFAGGLPEESSKINVGVVYKLPGTYPVVLTIRHFDNSVETLDFTMEVDGDPLDFIDKFGIYTEKDVVASVPITTVVNNAFIISTIGDAFDGSEALQFKFNNTDTWGVMGSIKPDPSPTDISEYAGGFYYITLKTTSNGKMNLRLQGGGNNGYVQLDDNVKTYGFERDGTWQTLKIPISDFKTDGGASPNLSAISDLLVLRSGESAVAAGEDWDWYVDDIYLAKE